MEKDKTIKEVDSTKELLRQAFSKNAGGVQKACYDFLDGLSVIGIAFFKAGGEGGWSDGVALPDKKLLSEEERQRIEQTLNPYKSTLLGIKQNISEPEENPRPLKQKGGAKPFIRKTGKSVKTTDETLNSFQKNPKEKNGAGGIVNPPKMDFTLSIDGAVKAVGDYIRRLDDQVHEVTDTLGPTAFINNMPVDPFIPNPLQAIGIPPPKFQIPKYSILPFFEAVLEVIRLVVIFGADDSPMFRKIMSITQAVYELSLGNWRQAIFTFIGYFGQNVGRMSSIGKIILQAWLLIDPTISSQLSKYAYKGVKSMFISFWLWIVHMLSPDFVWKPIGKFLDGINNTIEKGEEGIVSLEDSFTQTLQSMGYEGYTVDLPTLQEIVGQGEDAPPLRFSFDDLQNLQTLITMPFFLCSKEGQTIISALAKTPARLALELLNIPTLEEDIEEMCGTSSPEKMESLAVSMAKIVSTGLTIRDSGGEAVKAATEAEGKKGKGEGKAAGSAENEEAEEEEDPAGVEGEKGKKKKQKEEEKEEEEEEDPAGVVKKKASGQTGKGRKHTAKNQLRRNRRQTKKRRSTSS